ncbi:unnamed protein product [Prorocentrum cordatum]|uniref:Solute-binding protein family 5 domain-containing protein n=1 Tax=Prorocentrum cordatum TaxID=2364126 RepID=A0ABN9Q246_9DINO|nr:unnamed protein product [Polarella glacialis]
MDMGLQAAVGALWWDDFELSVCLPCLPPKVQLASEEEPVRYWGDRGNLTLRALRGNAVFTDGSGFAANFLELQRCGWAIVQLPQQGLPIRAVLGVLPGPLLTVGRQSGAARVVACGSVPGRRGRLRGNGPAGTRGGGARLGRLA